jgi:predicted DNA-binding transcriptional regulator YafY
MEKPRIARLTSLLTQLQSKRLTTAAELAKKHKVSSRTIYRDIRTLEEAGIPIFVEEGKGYSLVEGFHLPPVSFTESEAMALVTAQQIISMNRDESLVQNYLSAVTKIKAVLKNEERDRSEILSQKIQIRSNLKKLTTSNNLIEVQKALTNLLELEIKYNSLENLLSVRTIEPFAIYSTQENWLLIAFCKTKKDFRTFRLDRIESLKVTTRKFEPQKISLQEYFEICKMKTVSIN